MRWVCLILSCVICASDATAWQTQRIPALTEAQQIQLDTADDTRPPDEPAWYGLLDNVASWHPTEADPTVELYEAPASPPDYADLLSQPGDYRGDLYVVEGRFAGRQRRQVVLREGAWGRALTEWGMVLDSPGKGAHSGGGEKDRIVIVYLVDPDGRQILPRRNQRVEITARFYKLWQDVDAAGQSTTYPVFVGRYAALIEPETVAASEMFRQLIVGAIVVLMVGLFGIRWWSRRKRVAGRRRPRLGERRRENRLASYDDDDETQLPDDPAEALATLGETAGDAERRDA